MKTYEIQLGNFAHYEGLAPPGFGHTLRVLAAFLIYCEHNRYYPVLNDEQWMYGKWCDFFEPFWDESEKIEVLNLGRQREYCNINFEHGIGHRWGLDFIELPYVKPYYEKKIVELFRINKKIKTKIEREIKELPAIDLAINVRLGYEIPNDYNLEKYKILIEKIIEKNFISTKAIYLFTDNYAAIPFFEDFFGHAVFTNCPQYYDGSGLMMKTSEGFYISLKDFVIANAATEFIGPGFSGVPIIIKLIREQTMKRTFFI